MNRNFWIDNEGGFYEERPDSINTREFDLADEEEIRHTMGRYDCGAFKALKILSQELSVWPAEDYFGGWTDEELGITADADVLVLEKLLLAEHQVDKDLTSTPVPLEITGLREYLESRLENHLVEKAAIEAEDEEDK